MPPTFLLSGTKVRIPAVEGGNLMSSSTISTSDIIRKNISAITESQREDIEARTVSDRIADTITSFSGSVTFVLVHVIWFALWILLNVGFIRVPGLSGFDPFPFGLLTMVVSLEAIFLSTFVLISQNRLSMQSEQRAALDLHVNLLAEQKATKVLEMLDQIAQQLDQTSKRFNFKHDPEVEVLKVSPEPQEILGVIKEAIKEDAEQVRQEVSKAVKDIADEMDGVQEEVKDITGEMEAVRAGVKQIGNVKEEVDEINEKIDLIGIDVHQIKGKIDERTR